MADTGLDSFEAVANKLKDSTPTVSISQHTQERLRRMHTLIPMLFDAIEGYKANASDFPGGSTVNSLDRAISISAQITENK